jgi:hypothetical protein
MATFSIIGSLLSAANEADACVVPKNEAVTFEGEEFDLNELTWTTVGIDWKSMLNRCASSLGENKWVVSGYNAEGRAAVIIVEKLKEIK